MNKLYLLLFLLSLFNYQITYAGLESVATDGKTNTTTCASIKADTTTCVATPSLYRIYVYEMGLCNDILGTDDNTGISSSPSYFRNHCVKTYDAGSTPVEVIVENNKSSTLPSQYVVEPPNGSYTHGYVLLKNQIDLKGYQWFDKSVAVNGTAAGGGGSSDGINDTVCWTSGSQASRCSTAINQSTYTYNEAIFGNLGDTGNCSGVTNFHCSYNSIQDDAAGYDPTHAFMLDSSLNLETSNDADVNYLLGIASFRNLVVKSAATSTYEVEFKVTRGMTVLTNGTTSGYADIQLWGREFKTITRLTR